MVLRCCLAVVPAVWGCSFSANLVLAVVMFYCCECVALMGLDVCGILGSFCGFCLRLVSLVVV